MTELEKKLINALLMISNHISEPEVIKSIVDKAIGAEEDVIPIEEPEGDGPTPTPRPLSSGDEWGDDNDKKHEGFEEQAAGLAEILKGLSDGPNDNRW